MALPELDPIWLACAEALEIPVVRGGDSYVHFDGERLHIADDAALDEDDSLAQLVLHEICHLLVQGPTQRRAIDWGLDNTGAADHVRDEVRERAAVRLQAHLSGAYGLRAHFFPTTVVRPFYEALPARPLDEADDDQGSTAMAREAATRAGHAPYRRVLATALARSADALGIALHRGGAALDKRVRCGGCAWRSAGGLCRAAERRVFVADDERGCVRYERGLDCRTCGACCRSGYDAVPASTRSATVRRHPDLVVRRAEGFDLRRTVVEDEDRCAALQGPGAGPYGCAIYPDRPRACADLALASNACLQARRRVGLSVA